MRHATTIALLALLAAVLPAQETQPNLLLILTDDMGYGDLSCYGSKQIRTPNIDALASAGVRCTQGYVTATVCAPSRAGLLTGRYQNRFGFEHNLVDKAAYYREESFGIPRDEKTIADRLRPLGYRTGLIGKWHVGESTSWLLPNARGFDYFFGMRHGNHSYFPKAEKNRLYRNGESVKKIDEPYLTDWFTSEAIAFVDRAPKRKPWFLFLSYNTPHTPLQAKKADLARFAHLKNRKRRIYAAMQHCLDENIGRLLGHLDEKGLTKNTLVVFLNDNGGPCSSNGSINAPLRGQKSTVLEGGLRVPFLFRWPARLPTGKTYDHPVSALDVLPTFLAAAGGKLTPEFTGRGRNRKKRVYDGVDLLPFLRGEREGRRPHRTLYWRMILRSAAIRHDDWKLLRLPHRAPELYDLSKDVSERTNLASQRPELVNQLLQKLNHWESTFERTPMWLGSNRWMKINRASYDRDYVLVQPDR